MPHLSPMPTTPQTGNRSQSLIADAPVISRVNLGQVVSLVLVLSLLVLVVQVTG
ncbi:MAG: hypothetical protein LCH41_12900 [Armatimonadetes bacterium]|nr:hypothetical protein [Armatimonadota bacterium]